MLKLCSAPSQTKMQVVVLYNFCNLMRIKTSTKTPRFPPKTQINPAAYGAPVVATTRAPITLRCRFGESARRTRQHLAYST